METEYKKVPIEEIEKVCETDDIEPIKYGYGVRHVQALLCFICLALGYAARGHMGVTIVAMTEARQENYKSVGTTEAAYILVNNTIIDSFTSTEGFVENFTAIDELNENETDNKTDNKIDVDNFNIYKTHDWPKSIQESILGSFFLGYSIMMFPIGLVCQRWGGKLPLQIAMFVNGIVSFSTPWFISWGGWKTLCAIRILQGLAQAGLYPAANTVLANWIPVNERGSITSYVLAGSGIGTVIGFQSAGMLASSRFGWPSTFWVLGVACFIGFILITIFGATNPKDHKSVTEAEKMYIIGKVGKGTETKANVPWKSVVRSVPIWATFISHIGNAMSFVFFLMQKTMLKFNVKNSGLLSSLPHLAACISSIIYGYVSDFLTNRNIISVKTARKIFNCIGNFIPALCLTVVAYTTNTALAVTCLITFSAANAAIHTGWMVNYIDLAPNFSGVLMATGNTMANVLVVTLPVIVSNIVLDVTNQYQWRITMLIMASLTVSTNLIFISYMSADVQPWNNDDDTEKKNDSNDSGLESKNEKAAK